MSPRPDGLGRGVLGWDGSLPRLPLGSAAPHDAEELPGRGWAEGEALAGPGAQGGRASPHLGATELTPVQPCCGRVLARDLKVALFSGSPSPAPGRNGRLSRGQEVDTWLVSRVWRCTCEAGSSSPRSSWTRTWSRHCGPDRLPDQPTASAQQGGSPHLPLRGAEQGAGCL